VDRQFPSEFLIASLASEVDILATNKGLLIRYTGTNQDIDLSYKSSWDKISGITRAGTFLAQSIEHLVQLELVTSEQANLRINYEDLSELNELSSDFIEGLVPWAPFSVLIRAKGVLGTSSFEPTYQFMLGKQHSFPSRLGPFLLRSDSLYRLSPSNFDLIEVIDKFNLLPSLEKNKESGLLCLARIKDLTGGDGLDEYLQREGVIIPQKVKVDVVSESQGFISLFPTFDGVPSEAIKKEFFRFSDVQKVYDLQLTNGKRIRVLIPNTMIPILKDIQRIRRVGGSARDRIVADIMSCFSDGVDRELIDVIDFAPRVKGICSVPERAQLLINAASRGWSGIDEPEGENEHQGGNDERPLILRVETEDGTNELPLSFRDFRDLARRVAEAQLQDSAQVQYKKLLILINDPLVDQIRELEKRLDRRKAGGINIIDEVKSCQVLDIHQNFESTSYSEGNLETLNVMYNKADLPKALRETRLNNNGDAEPFQLKKHQEQGILWLQNLFYNRGKRRGCLLADDMGLGKTLQILTFLAWCIESGYKKGLSESTGPYEPILIIAPIILLQNWRDEMESYFSNDIFEPCLTLYDSKIRHYGIEAGQPGRETKDGRQKLDIERICENRVVITNYDTIKNYQHSLAKISWSVIVTDEAQEFKVQNQKSDALKALKAHFRIVATGTPVENRLLDLWNLVDYMHPGSLLGSAKDFHARYEKDINSKTQDEKKQLTRELRNALFYDRSDAFVLRRDKESQLTELPKKVEHRIFCPMPEGLKALHFDLVTQFKENDSEQHHFALIDSLKKLYLHPRLLQGLQPVDNPQTIISESPKLQKVIEVLESIRAKKEKVLIFTLQHDLQTILSQVLGAYFAIKVDIISGASDSQRKGMLTRRKEAIKAFEAKDGFNILILSLKVAGVGLTITGANHVIHYERWWNPAKEAQATDRAYRIGQKKNVEVYYFISKDEKSEIVSFDEKLDELLLEKKELAKDFLIPRESVEVSASEVAEGLQGAQKTQPKPSGGENLSIVSSLSDTDRLSPRQFEALIGLIYKRQGLLTVLCPLTRDGGADILVVGFKELFLIQCKHSSCMTLQGNKAIGDLEDAPDHYRREILSGNLLRRPIQRVAWTNSRFDQETKALAARCQIELKESKDIEILIKKMKIGIAEIIEFETERKSSLKEIRETLKHS